MKFACCFFVSCLSLVLLQACSTTLKTNQRDGSPLGFEKFGPAFVNDGGAILLTQWHQKNSWGGITEDDEDYDDYDRSNAVPNEISAISVGKHFGISLTGEGMYYGLEWMRIGQDWYLVADGELEEVFSGIQKGEYKIWKKLFDNYQVSSEMLLMHGASSGANFKQEHIRPMFGGSLVRRGKAPDHQKETAYIADGLLAPLPNGRYKVEWLHQDYVGLCRFQLIEADNSPRQPVEQIKVVRTPEQIKHLKVRSMYMGAVGKAEEGDFEDAIDTLHEILQLYPKSETPYLWAKYQAELAEIQLDWALSDDAQEFNARISHSQQSCQNAVDLFALDKSDVRWQSATNFLAWILIERAQRSEPSIASPMYLKAIGLYQEVANALKESDQIAWSEFIVKIGRTWELRAEKHFYIFAMENLNNALKAYRLAATAQPVSEVSLLAAATQVRIAETLKGLVDYLDGGAELRLMREASDAYRKAIACYKTAKVDEHIDFAELNFEFGDHLTEMDQYLDGEELIPVLKESLLCFEAALKIYDREEVPNHWSYCHYLSAHAKSDLGGLVGGERGIEFRLKAIASFQQCVLVAMDQKDYKDWAHSNYWIGAIYWDIAQDPSSKDKKVILGKAAEAFSKAVELLRPLNSPIDLGESLYYLSEILVSQAKRKSPSARIEQLNLAISVCTEAIDLAGSELDWSELSELKARMIEIKELQSEGLD